MIIKRMTTSEYLSDFSSPLLKTDSAVIDLVPDFLKDAKFQLILASVMSTQYGDYYLRDKYSVEPSHIQDDVTTWYAANGYKYKGMYDSTQLEYNPIENYNMIEKGEDITNGGSTDINNYGQRVIKDVEGERTDSNVIGTKVTDSLYPQYSDTNTKAVSPYDTNTYTQKEQDTLQHGSHTDKVTENSHTDQYTKGAIESSSTENEREDTLENEHHTTLEHSLTRSGNIGITTTQQMLASQREIVDFSIYLMIAKELMKILCIRVGLEHKYIVIEEGGK